MTRSYEGGPLWLTMKSPMPTVTLMLSRFVKLLLQKVLKQL